MVQSENHLPCKLGDLRFTPESTFKKSMVLHTSNPNAGEVEIGRSWGSHLQASLASSVICNLSIHMGAGHTYMYVHK